MGQLKSSLRSEQVSKLYNFGIIMHYHPCIYLLTLVFCLAFIKTIEGKPKPSFDNLRERMDDALSANEVISQDEKMSMVLGKIKDLVNSFQKGEKVPYLPTTKPLLKIIAESPMRRETSTTPTTTTTSTTTTRRISTSTGPTTVTTSRTTTATTVSPNLISRILSPFVNVFSGF